jgi:hypothetical protein
MRLHCIECGRAGPDVAPREIIRDGVERAGWDHAPEGTPSPRGTWAAVCPQCLARRDENTLGDPE